MTGIVFSNVWNLNFFENDLSLQEPDYLYEFLLTGEPDPPPIDLLWPRSRVLSGDYANEPTALVPVRWLWEANPTGSSGKFIVMGIAKNAAGAVLAGATVKLYRTSTDEMVGSATSEADGAYSVGTPYTGNHYVVAYKAGSPDVAGTTLNTLVGV